MSNLECGVSSFTMNCLNNSGKSDLGKNNNGGTITSELVEGKEGLEKNFDRAIDLLKPRILQALGYSTTVAWNVIGGSPYSNLDALHKKIVIGLPDNSETTLHVKQGVNPTNLTEDRPLYKAQETSSFGTVRELPYLLALSKKGLAPKIILTEKLNAIGDDIIVMENFPWNLREYTNTNYDKKTTVSALRAFIRRFQIETYKMAEGGEFSQNGLFSDPLTHFNKDILFRKLEFWTDLFKLYRFISTLPEGEEQFEPFLEGKSGSIWEYVLAGAALKRQNQGVSGLEIALKPVIEEFLSVKRIPSHFDLRAQNILCKIEGDSLILVPCDYQRPRMAVGLWDYSVAYCDPSLGLDLEEILTLLKEDMGVLIKEGLMEPIEDYRIPSHLLASLIFGSTFNVGKALEQRIDSGRYRKFLVTSMGKKDERYEIGSLMNRTLHGLSRVCAHDMFKKIESIGEMKKEMDGLVTELDSIVGSPKDSQELAVAEPEKKRNFFLRLFSRPVKL